MLEQRVGLVTITVEYLWCRAESGFGDYYIG